MSKLFEEWKTKNTEELRMLLAVIETDSWREEHEDEDEEEHLNNTMFYIRQKLRTLPRPALLSLLKIYCPG
jgi:hypothetical protein